MSWVKRLTVASGIVVLVIVLAGYAFAAPIKDRRRIVLFQEGTPEPMKQLVVTLSGSVVVHSFSLINAIAIELPVDSIDAALTFLLSQAAVASVYDDLIGLVPPIMPIAPDQEPQKERHDWGLEQIGVATVHQESPTWTGAGVTVAILDTGIDSGHSELRNRIVNGYNARPRERSYADNHGHGTHMAGIIAAEANGKRIIGAAPKVNVVAVKVLGADGSGRTSDMIQGLEWVCDQGLRLVNLSLGFSAENPPLEQATKRFKEDCGGIMLAAAGNRCSDNPGQEEGADSEGEGTQAACDASQNNVKSPARYPWVIAVGATNMDEEITPYSLAGPSMRTTGVVAPGGEKAGEQILSTYLNNRLGLGSGSSQATAHATGVVALLLQQQPGLSFEQVLAWLQSTARDLGYADVDQGAGEIDALQLKDALD